jgi:FkbH-like protein
MKVFLTSNVNMQPLVRRLRPWDVVCGTYNSLLGDLATNGSPATAADITHLLCLYDTDSLMGDTLYGAGPPEQCELLLAAVDGFCSRNPDKIVVTHRFCLGSNRWLGFADELHESSLTATAARLNLRLTEIARTHRNLMVFDLDVLFRRHGEDALISNAFWYAGRIRYTAKMFELLATTIQRAVAAHAQRCRKVLVVDLDNTLWGGIVGEVGALGIALSEDGEGRCYRDFQRSLKAIQKTGVLLAIVSKNNAADVDEVFDQNPMMILRREDFAVIRANWRTKAENIAAIAETLNLGVDSFVFIDDNPVERDAVAQFLPEVAVPPFPARVENLQSWLVRDVAPTYFGKYLITPEDAAKTEQYRANEARRKMVANFDLDGYLAELGIECAIHVDVENQLLRAAQMTQKTNQFNLTTRRYDVTDLARFVHSPEHAVLLLDYRDRFGEEGSVALAIVDLAEGRIDTFLTSCRVIGRKVEDRLLDKAVELCRARGHRKIVGEYIPTQKNQLAADFYEIHGFTPSVRYPDGRKIYERAIDAGPSD